MKTYCIILLCFSLTSTAFAQWPQFEKSKFKNPRTDEFNVDLGSNPLISHTNVVPSTRVDQRRISPVVIENGIVFIGSYDGNLQAFHPKRLVSLWKKERGTTYAPAVFADIVVSFSSLQVFASDAYTGELFWQYRINSPGAHPVLIDPERFTAFIVDSGGQMYAFNVFSGALLWASNLSDTGNRPLVASPAVTSTGTIISATGPISPSNYGTVYAFNPTTGIPSWETTLPGNLVNSGNFLRGITIGQTGIYFTHQSNGNPLQVFSFFRIGLSGGEIARASSFPLEAGHTNLLLSFGENKVVLGSSDAFDRGLYTYNASDGSGIASLQSNIVSIVFSPALAMDANGIIFVGNDNGQLYEVDLSGQVRVTHNLVRSLASGRNALDAVALAPKFVSTHTIFWHEYLTIVANRSMGQYPEVRQRLDTLRTTPNTPILIDLESPLVFRDPDGGPLNYSVRVADSTIAKASISGDMLSVNPLSQGATHLIISADDGIDGKSFLTVPVAVSNATSISESSDNLPVMFKLYQNYPNPFNPTTYIEFDIPSGTHVNLSVYTVSGSTVKTIYDGYLNAGNHKVRFDTQELPTGIYFYKIETEKFVQTKKMVLIR